MNVTKCMLRTCCLDSVYLNKIYKNATAAAGGREICLKDTIATKSQLYIATADKSLS